MQQFPPNPPPKKGAGRPTPAGSRSALFSTASRPVVQDALGDSQATRRTERGVRLAGDIKRALFFVIVLVFVGIVLYQFVTATAL